MDSALSTMQQGTLLNLTGGDAGIGMPTPLTHFECGNAPSTSALPPLAPPASAADVRGD